MEDIALVLDGHLDAPAEPGDSADTAFWRLNSSPTDHLIHDALIPCTTNTAHVANTLLTECRPGDLLRVVGRLTLPDTGQGPICLHADSVEILWQAPDLPDDEDTPEASAEIGAAIESLAQALAGGQAPGPDQRVRIHLSPTGAPQAGVDLSRSLHLTPARAHQLADAIDAMNAFHSSGPLDGLDEVTVADLNALFGDLDLVDLTHEVLKTAPPQAHRAICQAMDAMFGDIDDPSLEDGDTP
ncbi:hypothetical protein ACIO3O_40205 [Streptomyces sp. NPDC087440]|uniref:hypothetical protein n=1 Tax=Streptomyces sp. NPDC087440 TaxID=3365790 RepID=UPI003804DF39